MGGTSVKYALVSEEGEVHFAGKLPAMASVSAPAVLEQLAIAAGTVMREAAGRNCPLKGIGVGTPGIIDETNRVVLGGAENIIGWEQVDIASFLEARTGLPVIVGNDANLMGLGETKYGAAKGCSDVVFLTVGTGIGGAVITGGRLFAGYANRGTELGHVPLIATGEPCACGSAGCLEQYASTAALVKRFTTLAGKKGVTFREEINGELIVQLYRQQVPLAVTCLNEHFFYLGRGIAGFIHIFSPQRVVVGGGLPEAGAFYLEALRKVIHAHAIPACALNTEIVIASLGNRAGCIGAASLML